MKRLLLYISLLLVLFSCSGNKKHIYTIQGEGVGSGRAYLFGFDNKHKQISSVECNGSFSFSTSLNKNTMLTLVLPNGKALTLFAEPGMTATLHNDSTLKSGWRIEGSRTHTLHDSISHEVDKARNSNEEKKIIEAFSKKYPLSEVNIELFRRYLIEIPTPDNEYLRRTIPRLSGALQDHEYFINMNRRLDKRTGDIKHRMFPSFSYTTIDGESIHQGTYSKKYLLVTFWATWSKESIERLKTLKDVKAGIKSESFAILNIALDSDTALMKEIIIGDSIVGDNTYDPEGFNSSTLEVFNLARLPYSVLVTPYKRIAEYNIKTDSCAIALIDSLTQKHDKR